MRSTRCHRFLRGRMWLQTADETTWMEKSGQTAGPPREAGGHALLGSRDNPMGRPRSPRPGLGRAAGAAPADPRGGAAAAPGGPGAAPGRAGGPGPAPPRRVRCRGRALRLCGGRGAPRSRAELRRDTAAAPAGRWRSPGLRAATRGPQH
ncbi:translation initiation factor IF-2-like [Pipra filicauda]|uniref:Translation initiation factor IF-2-like n=1 Tax=Pipra filicauda TaxID=649802 RepID=A0A7R5K9L3_9PASS|nr:translation initiation factor IF-2-like [Pipra filicauda]